MPMKNPPHPGGLVLRQCIEPLGLTVTQAAAALGVTRTTLSELVNGKRGISPRMAVRLEKVFGSSAKSWLVQQAQYDLVLSKIDSRKNVLEERGRLSADDRRRIRSSPWSDIYGSVGAATLHESRTRYL